MAEICTADRVCLSLLVFTQLFSELASCQPAKPARKQNLTPNSPSRSFKVIHFGVTGKATGDWIILYNNIGLISKDAEDVASKIHENRRFRLPHCRLTPPLQRTPANIRTNFMSPDTRWPTFLSLIVWVYLHSHFCGGLQKMHLLIQWTAYQPFKVIQGRWFWHQSKGRMRLPINH